METTDFLTALARDGVEFADACEAAGPNATVPACPEWTVSDLMWHLTEVLDFWSTVVDHQLTDPDEYVQPARPSAAELPSFFRSSLRRALDVLGSADPDQSNWTWTSDQSAGFVQRRMAHETAVHLADAQQAAGRSMSVESNLASDGIDEFLQHFLRWGADAPAVGGSVHLHCTDVAGEWTVREVEGAPVVAREHAKGDCALRGAASDLLLVLWRRLPISAADVVGDADVAARFVASTRLD